MLKIHANVNIGNIIEGYVKMSQKHNKQDEQIEPLYTKWLEEREKSGTNDIHKDSHSDNNKYCITHFKNQKQ